MTLKGLVLAMVAHQTREAGQARWNEIKTVTGINSGTLKRVMDSLVQDGLVEHLSSEQMTNESDQVAYRQPTSEMLGIGIDSIRF